MWSNVSAIKYSMDIIIIIRPLNVVSFKLLSNMSVMAVDT